MNIWSITGNLGRDAEKKVFGTSTVLNFTVAAKSGYGDKEQTEWVDCALWGKQAESKLIDYLKKGQSVAVSGELSTFTTEAGKTYLKLKVSSIDLTGGKSDVPDVLNNISSGKARATGPGRPDVATLKARLIYSGIRAGSSISATHLTICPRCLR